MQTITQGQFAKRRGVSRAAVTQWKAKGLLSMTADGLVKVEESEWLLADRPQTYRGGKTKPARPTNPEPKQPTSPLETSAAAAERIVVQEGLAPFAHAEAVRIKENYLALLRQLEYERESGKVVEIADATRAMAVQSAKVRAKLLALPSRVSPRVAILTSPEQIKALIDAEVVLICRELSFDGHGDIVVDELRRAS